MDAQSQIVALTTYVPKWVRRAYRNSGGILEPYAARRQAALLFLDLAGFSKETAHLAASGPSGVEELSKILNDTFSPLVDIIDKQGGDVVAFVGDGIVALWESDLLARDTQMAIQCGLQLQKYMKYEWDYDYAPFRMRVAIDCGEIFYCRIGGGGDRWRHLVVGTPLAAVGAAYRRAGPGDVLLCPKARDAAGPLLQYDVIDHYYSRAIAVTAARAFEMAREDAPLPLQELQRLLPVVVLERATAFAGIWLAEFRNLSVVQICLKEVEFGQGLLQALQEYYSEIENISRRLEGIVLHIQMDDKGVNAIVLFGLPPQAHEDDPLRAIQAALTMHNNLEARGHKASIGVSSGLSFCGEYGGQQRREYSAFGLAVNLSSRLMEIAGSGVLCDAATAAAVEKRVSFSASTTLNLKGWPQPIAAFRPEIVSRPLQSNTLRRAIGRDRERTILRDALERLKHGEGGLLVVQGEAGIGKSTLLSDLIRTARATNFRVLHAAATAIDQATTYFVWRDILSQLLTLDRGSETSQLRRRLERDLAQNSHLANWLPLLEDIIPLGFDPNFITTDMSHAARAAGIEELVVYLLTSFFSRQPTLVVIDDAQWIDGASVSLARAIVHRLPQILLVTAQRIAERPDFDEVRSLDPDVEILLEGLPREAVVEIICQRLGVSSVPRALAEFVTARASGNPFYCEEMTFALRDTGVLQVERGECRAPGDLSSDQTVLPNSVRSVVVARFDTLSLEKQLALKVASALEGSFSPELVQEVYPQETNIDHIHAILDTLVAKDMLNLTENDSGRRYKFRHTIFQNAVYELLSFSQRHVLHKKIASIIETRHQGALDPVCGQLARHWELANRPDLAIPYLERAADQALRSYSNLDAIRYVQRATQLTTKSGVSVDPRITTLWETMLGDAHHELRDFSKASVHYQRALMMLGHQVPSTAVKRMLDIVANAARQTKHRLFMPNMPGSASADMKCVAHIYERLSEEHFYHNDPILVLHGTLVSLNFAERSGSVAETISGYNGLALGLGMAGMVGAARYYSRRAFQLAEGNGALPEVARAHLVAGVLNAGLGEWNSAQHNAERARVLFRQLGDRVRLENTHSLAIFEAILRCDLSDAESALDDLTQTIAADANVTADIRGWHVCAGVSIDGIRGSIAPSALEDLRAIRRSGLSSANRLLCCGVLAGGCLQTGDLAAAHEAALEGAAVLQKSSVVWAAFGVLGAGGVSQALIAYWERATEEQAGDRSAAREAACNAVSKFFSLSRRSPVCWPWALLLRGRIAFLSGNAFRARRDWEQASRAGLRLGMPYVVGLAFSEIAFRSTQNAEERLDYLNRAERIFSTLGANHDLVRVKSALSGVSPADYRRLLGPTVTAFERPERRP
jgi:class 3 adenylate cyclase/tetratricopeptide (TPR) repeat protein